MNIVITGASRGIGFASALELAARRGHEVLALSRDKRKLDELREAAKNLALDCRLSVLPFDLTQPDWTALEAAAASMSQVDVLINNAGFLTHKPFEQLGAEDWARTFEVNVFGPARLIRALLPAIRRAERPHILNIASMGGFQGSAKFPGLAAYSASKGAMAVLSECLAEEFKDDRIAVNCLALGAVDTEMLRAAFPHYQAPLASARMAEFIADFAVKGHWFFNGKILPVSLSTP
jgi:NAD(P)-dependent dehydrogenase (short-subunit alcohol dehydrogenase family)